MEIKKIDWLDLAVIIHMNALPLLVNRLKEMAPFYVSKSRICDAIREITLLTTGLCVSIQAGRYYEKMGLNWQIEIEHFVNNWFKDDRLKSICLSGIEYFWEKKPSIDDFAIALSHMVKLDFSGLIKQRYLRNPTVSVYATIFQFIAEFYELAGKAIEDRIHD